MPTLSVLGGVAGEGDSSYSTLTYTIALDSVATETIAINWRILDSTGVSALDHYGGSYLTGTAYIHAGQSTATVRSYAYGDLVPEFDEGMILEIFKPVNADLSGSGLSAQAVGWILDDDGTSNAVSVAVTSPTVIEGRTAVYEVELSRALAQATSIGYTLGGSAKAGSDYQDKSGTLSFSAGQTKTTVSVKLSSDNIAESLEFLDLKLDLPGAVGGTVVGGRATILDDDGPSGPFVSVQGGRVIEGDSSYKNLVFLLALSEPATATVSIPWRLGVGTATTGTDHYGGSYASGTAYIYAGNSTARVNAYAYGDAVLEADESVILEVLTPNGAQLPGGVNILSATGWIMDDDNSGKTLALQVSNPQVVEEDNGRNTASFDFELSDVATRDLTFTWRTDPGTAKGGRDFVKQTGTVVIKEGQSKASVGVEVIGDSGREDDETFGIQIIAPSDIAAIRGGTATILDDGDTGLNWIYGNDKPNRLSGEGYDDGIVGRGGNDRLNGLSGDDLLLGRAGNDALFGGSGRDTLRGDAGADNLVGGGGGDKMYGGGGNDTFDGKGGADSAFGKGGADIINGNGGSDTLKGNGGDDRLFGGGGSDDLDGGGKSDVLNGGKGSDILSGGAGRDRLIGGAQADIFVFNNKARRDVVVDFEDGTDIVEITSGARRFRQLDIERQGEDVLVDFAKTTIVLLDTRLGQIDATDFIFS